MDKKFIPTCKDDLADYGWSELDIILITGDAYIDHPAFGVPLLARYLLDKGFRVGIIAQPQTDEDYQVLGRPKLFFGISSGNVDSMVNHYTAQRKIRSEDDFSPNGKAGLRPDRAVLIYTQKVKQLFKGVFVVIGGIEASMRRIPHYDFMSDKVRNSILLDSKADILVYGSGERQILEIATKLTTPTKSSEFGVRSSEFRIPNSEFRILHGTCIISKEIPVDAILLPTHITPPLPPPINVGGVPPTYMGGGNSPHIYGNENSPHIYGGGRGGEKDLFYQMTKAFNTNYQTKTLYYPFGNRYFVHYPPAEPLTTEEIDALYNLPFVREPHPRYKGKIIKAFEQIKHSILSHRGCYGGCSFCALGFHQGKTIQSRSKESILKEIKHIAQKSYFKGTITDIAGATANMYGTFCKAKKSKTCPKQSCLYPEMCKNLSYNEKQYLSVLKAAKASQKVKNVFISSGVRHDLALHQPEIMQELTFFYTSGTLKLAPEHVSEKVLTMMYKPSITKYLEFSQVFFDISKKIEKKQFIIPYLIVGFPGCTLQDAQELANFLKKHNLRVEQIQEFTPTPMTIATMMYYTGKDYETGEDIYVPKGREIKQQKALAQWFKKELRIKN